MKFYFLKNLFKRDLKLNGHASIQRSSYTPRQCTMPQISNSGLWLIWIVNKKNFIIKFLDRANLQVDPLLPLMAYEKFSNLYKKIEINCWLKKFRIQLCHFQEHYMLEVRYFFLQYVRKFLYIYFPYIIYTRLNYFYRIIIKMDYQKAIEPILNIIDDNTLWISKLANLSPWKWTWLKYNVLTKSTKFFKSLFLRLIFPNF